MTSKTDIANRSLIRLGSNLISSIDQSDNKNAETMKLLFNPIRQQLIRAHLWNFAVKRVTLAPLTTTPAFEYSYEFQLPSDCLRVVRLRYDEQMYKIEGGKLLCDDNSVGLIYIRDITDINAMDDSFIDAFVLKLAAEACLTLTGNQSLQQNLLIEYDRAIKMAKQHDAQEDRYNGMSLSVWSTIGE